MKSLQITNTYGRSQTSMPVRQDAGTARSLKSIAVFLFLVASLCFEASYGCANVRDVPFELGWYELQWEAKEFWRRNVVPLRDWKKNADATQQITIRPVGRSL